MNLIRTPDHEKLYAILKEDPSRLETLIAAGH